MNFVLIQFLARSVLALLFLVAQIAWLHCQQEWQLKRQPSNSSITVSTGEGDRAMDTAEIKQIDVGHKGPRLRKSYGSINEGHNQSATNSVEMQREESNKSQKSASPSKADSISVQHAMGPAGGLGQPVNFGTVIPGVYRSSYPQEADYPFMQKLGLKTIVTLVDKEFPANFVPFMKANGIEHCHIVMEGTKKQTIPVQTMATILRVVHDKRNHPLLIHCNQGRHRTGCVVAITRKIQQWSADRILAEYKAYAEPKPRDCDIQYITDFQVADVEHLALGPMLEAVSFPNTRVRRSSIRFLAFTFILMMIVYSVSNFGRRPNRLEQLVWNL